MNSHIFFKQYFEAANEILNGTPIKNLDEIRQKCNKQFLENNIYYGLNQKLILASFIDDAENKILLGKNPEKIYLFNGDPKSFRENSRKLLEEIIKEYSI